MVVVGALKSNEQNRWYAGPWSVFNREVSFQKKDHLSNYEALNSFPLGNYSVSTGRPEAQKLRKMMPATLPRPEILPTEVRPCNSASS